MRSRLDIELARRGLASSRQVAQRLIMAGCVRVNSRPAAKPDLQVNSDTVIEVFVNGSDYASRGAYKLLAALDEFPVSVAGRRALDVGASNGGFTDVLLRRGASQVIALDVGYGQLAARLRADPRVIIRDRCNIRTLTPQDLPWLPELTTIDVSFISLTIVLPCVHALGAVPSEVIALIKPQFEIGKGRVGKGGVVRDSALQLATVSTVTDCAQHLGYEVGGVIPSPIKGAAGNQEYLAWLRQGRQPLSAAE